ncbi:MAG: DoxX family protein [Marinifilaceae bacterium]
MIEGLQIVLTGLFLLAGIAKLFRAKPLQEQFVEFGFANHFILIVGALEILGAIALQIKTLELWASLGLTILMLGAIHQHVKVKHPLSKSAPAGVLLLLLILNKLLSIGIV